VHTFFIFIVVFLSFLFVPREELVSFYSSILIGKSSRIMTGRAILRVSLTIPAVTNAKAPVAIAKTMFVIAATDSGVSLKAQVEIIGAAFNHKAPDAVKRAGSRIER
jgi:hypothetical protein